ncbi:MAG: DUF2332 domain-containing protein [Pseudomonadota bacterium]
MLGDTKIQHHFAEQAQWCEELGSPFTAALLRKFAQDFEASGPIYQLCKDWPGNPRKDALGLRLAGALHHAVLATPESDLAQTYPARSPDWTFERVWPLARNWLSENTAHVSDFIRSPPQTNETRRAIILLPGFLELSARFGKPLRLLELGASAGLNQAWDQFNYSTQDWQRPAERDRGVHVTTEWIGPSPGHLNTTPTIASRRACDLSPVDLSDEAQIRRLKCYTWPDQPERLARLDAAIALALDTGVTVERADAADWLEARLAEPVQDALTVIYHSVFLIYPPRDQIARIMEMIETAGAAATESAPLAWLCYESEALFGGDRTSPQMLARLQTWPGGDARVYARSDGHVTKVEYSG